MRVESTPVTGYAASVEGLINNKLDMVWFGSFTFVQAKVRSKDQVIALVQREEDEKFKSVFITTKADINKLEDLKGKTFTFGSESSTSGHLIQRSFFSDAALKSALEFLQGFAPPDLSTSLLKKVFFASFETLAMSALGTLIAAIAGLFLALPASGRFGSVTKSGTRLFLNVARAVPELVWAAIMLIAAGLGPFAGTIALAAHTTGVLGRLFAEALENAPTHDATTLRLNGASTLNVFLYATLPEAIPQMLSYTLYRWENNIRAAAILGVVGAGGLGQMLKYHLSLFQMQTAATVIIAMLLLVAMVDALSFALRRWLMH